MGVKRVMELTLESCPEIRLRHGESLGWLDSPIPAIVIVCRSPIRPIRGTCISSYSNSLARLLYSGTAARGRTTRPLLAVLVSQLRLSRHHGNGGTLDVDLLDVGADIQRVAVGNDDIGCLTHIE